MLKKILITSLVQLACIAMEEPTKKETFLEAFITVESNQPILPNSILKHAFARFFP